MATASPTGEYPQPPIDYPPGQPVSPSAPPPVPMTPVEQWPLGTLLAAGIGQALLALPFIVGAIGAFASKQIIAAIILGVFVNLHRRLARQLGMMGRRRTAVRRAPIILSLVLSIVYTVGLLALIVTQPRYTDLLLVALVVVLGLNALTLPHLKRAV